MFKTIFRILLGSLGACLLVLILIDTFLPGMSLAMPGWAVHLYAALVVAAVPIIFAGIFSLCFFKGEPHGRSRMLLLALGFGLCVSIVRRFTAESELGLFWGTLVETWAIASCTSLVIVAAWSDWDYRGKDAMRSPAHVP